MKIKSLTIALIASLATVLGTSSCSSDDDEPEAPVATQVAGSYTGNEVIMVDNDESSNETKTYEITKASDTSVDMTVPEWGMGMMTIPSFIVKNIPLAKSGNTITGKVASYSGTVKNAKGEEKAYVVSNVALMFSDKKVVGTYSLKYGNMPFLMTTTFTGTRK
ncbi:MAG: hypothetical protein II115_04880 [Prevotella sp.]|jgi:hypothetical protein|nr:hypothetical protein [Prevotella sp.]MBQ2208707.1 hypothetical protein [Prevotella sp.]